MLLSVLIKIFARKKIHIIYYRQMKLTREKKGIYHKFIYKNIKIIFAITENLKNECNNFLPVSNHAIKKLPYGIEEYQKSQTPAMNKEELCKDFNWNLSSFTALETLMRFFSFTEEALFNTRDTVAIETPARRATSSIEIVLWEEGFDERTFKSLLIDAYLTLTKLPT